MAFPLMAIGAGLGQFAQEYRQQQESALRQMAVQQQLDQIKRDQMAKGMLTQAFGLEGGVPGFGGSGAQGQQPQAPQMGGAPMTPVSRAPLPPMSSPAQPPAMGSRSLTETGQETLERTPHELTPEQADQLYRTAGADQSRAGVPMAPAPPTSGAADAGGVTTSVTDTPLGTGGAPAAAPAADAGVQTHDEMSKYLGMFQKTDPAAWVKRIKAVRPNAPDDVVWDAVERLHKMAQGDIRQQIAAANMGKFLMNLDFQEQKAQGVVKGVPTLAAQNAATAAGNLDVRKDTQTRLKAQFSEKVQQFNARFQQSKASLSATDRRTALNGLLRDIEKQLYPGFGATQPTDEEKAVLMKQREEVVNTLRGAAGMKPLAPGAPAAPTE